jgi:hypothetical protein
MKFVVTFLSLALSASSFANCLMRLTIDPSYSKTVLASFEKMAKAKKYKIITESDERWEHFRLQVGNPSVVTEGVASEVVSVKLQKYVSPNFEVAYEKTQSLSQSNRDLLAMEYLKDVPSCPQALYSDIFANLND